MHKCIHVDHTHKPPNITDLSVYSTEAIRDAPIIGR